MEAIWLKGYPPGIPAEIDVFEFTSLRDMLLRSCQRFGKLPASNFLIRKEPSTAHQTKRKIILAPVSG